MYHQLATRFARNAHQITGRATLDNDALRAHVPSIFASEEHDSRSDRYVYVPTIKIVEGLRREEWQPFFAVQAMPRDGSRHGYASTCYAFAATTKSAKVKNFKIEHIR